MVTAAVDTTATTMMNFLRYMCKFPRYQELVSWNQLKLFLKSFKSLYSHHIMLANTLLAVFFVLWTFSARGTTQFCTAQWSSATAIWASWHLCMSLITTAWVGVSMCEKHTHLQQRKQSANTSNTRTTNNYTLQWTLRTTFDIMTSRYEQGVLVSSQLYTEQGQCTRYVHPTRFVHWYNCRYEVRYVPCWMTIPQLSQSRTWTKWLTWSRY